MRIVATSALFEHAGGATVAAEVVSKTVAGAVTQTSSNYTPRSYPIWEGLSVRLQLASSHVEAVVRLRQMGPLGDQ